MKSLHVFAMVSILTFSTIAYSQESEKVVTVKPGLFSTVYPAMWFSPSTGDLTPLKDKSEKPPVPGYEIWIEPQDPEIGFLATEKSVGFMLIGKGDSAFREPDIPTEPSLERAVKKAFMKMDLSEKPVFYVKGRNSSCLIMITELDYNKHFLKFKWKLIESNETEATVKEIKRIAVQEGELAKFSVTVNKENIVSSRIEGEWVIEENLTTVLGGKEFVEKIHRTNMKRTFRIDHSIIKDLPEEYYPYLKDKKIYTCGFLTMRGKTHPFYLTEWNGNPHIFYFYERDGDPMGNGESFNVMLAVAKENANDLLFVGGDFNNQPFIAYKRAGK